MAVTHLQPDHNQIPKANHAQLGRTTPLPRTRILDRNDIHEVEDELHGEEAGEEAECVGGY